MCGDGSASSGVLVFLRVFFRHGFAVRCAAMALPRRERALSILGDAPGPGFAFSNPNQLNADGVEQSGGQRPKQGHSP